MGLYLYLRYGSDGGLTKKCVEEIEPKSIKFFKEIMKMTYPKLIKNDLKNTLFEYDGGDSWVRENVSY